MFTCNTIHPSPENNHDELHRSSNQPAPPTVSPFYCIIAIPIPAPFLKRSKIIKISSSHLS